MSVHNNGTLNIVHLNDELASDDGEFHFEPILPACRQVTA